MNRGHMPVLLCLLGTAAVIAAPVQIETAVEPAQPLVNAQVVYRLRFLHSVDVQQVQLRGPQARLAEVRPLGPVQRHEEVRQGTRYRVHEARYLVFPFASGSLELVGGEVSGRRPGGEVLRVGASPTTLTVMPAVPHDVPGTPWLPARSVRIVEVSGRGEWAWTLGQPVERTVAVEAVGVDASLLPPLQIDTPDFQVTAATTRLSNRIEGENNVGRREQIFRMTPLAAGRRSLADVRLPWWDVENRRWDVAVLPGRDVLIDDPREAVSHASDGAASFAARTPVRPFPVVGGWLTVTGLGALVVLVLGVRYGRVVSQGIRLWRARQSIVVACRRRRPDQARDALLCWGSVRWPAAPPRGLDDLAQRIGHPEFRNAVAALQRHLYGPRDALVVSWSGRQLVDVLPAGVRLGDSEVCSTDPS